MLLLYGVLLHFLLSSPEVFHRGLANEADRTRVVLYATFLGAGELQVAPPEHRWQS